MFETGTGLGSPNLAWIWLVGYIMVPILAYLKLKWIEKS
jgi:hypothetical protein